MQTITDADVQDLESMGFAKNQVIEALKKFNGDKESALNYILTNSSQAIPVGPAQPLQSGQVVPNIAEDDDISRAIAMSLQDSTPINVFELEPLNPDERQRQAGVPVGLKNVGNTCYFNSLLQTYFMVPRFVQEIFKFNPAGVQLQDDNYGIKTASVKLVEELQRLFAFMIRSNRKYLDPSKVLDALVDDFGNRFEVGDQKDVGEFNMILISRIEEGLKPNIEQTDPQQPQRKGSFSSSRLSVDHLTQEGAISSMLYGKMKEIVTYQDQSGQNQQMVQEAVFAQIMLDIFDNDLYNAWDSAYHTEIEDFTTPEGMKATAYQDVWLDKVPNILFFQISRVQYNRVTGNLEKNNKQFEFPKIIYPDRFMTQNQPQCSSLRNQLIDTKQKIKHLQEAIDRFNNYEQTKSGVLDILQNSLNLLQNQINNPDHIQMDTEVQLFDPDNILSNSTKQLQNIQHSIQILEHIRQNAQQQLESMQRQLHQYKQIQEQIYDRNELKRTAYHLHSILMHDGFAGSGHFYSYIYDHYTQKWWSYSDIQVYEVTEEQVLTEAIGLGHKSAYCLIYVNANTLFRGFEQLTQSKSSAAERSFYEGLIPELLKFEVNDDNSKAEFELEQFQTEKMVNQIHQLYVERYNKIQAEIGNFRKAQANQFMRYEVINFVVHLKIKFQEGLSRLILLDYCLMEVAGIGLEVLEPDSTLFKALTQKLGNFTQCKPYSFSFSESEIKMRAREYENFMRNYHDAQLIILMIEFIEQDLPVHCFHAVAYYLQLERDPMSEFKGVIQTIFKATLLRCCSGVNQYIYQNDQKHAVLLANQINHIMQMFIPKADIIQTQVCNVIKSSHQYLQQRNAPEQAQFYQMIVDMQQGKYQEVIELHNQPQQLQDFIIEAQTYQENLNQWIDGWAPESLARQYVSCIKILQTGKLSIWIQIQQQIEKSKRLVTSYQWEEYEKQAGIIPPRQVFS